MSNIFKCPIIISHFYCGLLCSFHEQNIINKNFMTALTELAVTINVSVSINVTEILSFLKSEILSFLKVYLPQVSFGRLM